MSNLISFSVPSLMGPSRMTKDLPQRRYTVAREDITVICQIYSISLLFT